MYTIASCRFKNVLLILVALATIGCQGKQATTTVVGWRTDGSGRYPAATPPLEWSPDKNVVWATPMPSWSNSTPVIVGDRLFVCSEPTTLLCVRRSNGDILWQRDNSLMEMLDPAAAEQVRQDLADSKAAFEELKDHESKLRRVRRRLKKGEGDTQQLEQKKADLEDRIARLNQQLAPLIPYRQRPTHKANGYSTSTPVTDGKRVYVLFGNGVAACYDMEGERKWLRKIEDPEHDFGHSASPVLVGGVLVVHVKNLVGLDASNGQTLWQVEAEHRWGTPLAVKFGTRPTVVTANGRIVDVSNGDILNEELGALEYCSPVVHDRVLYLIQKNSRAWKLPEHDATPLSIDALWTGEIKGSRHYASPLVHDGLIYTVSRGELLTAIDAATGEKVYEQELDLEGANKNSVYPSVTLAGDYLFAGSESGVTIVFRPGRDFHQVARNKLESFRSSPVFLGRRMYVRCAEHLYCIEAPVQAAR